MSVLQGVFDGVTGIVRKPVEGAKKEGVEGFFKGKDYTSVDEPVQNHKSVFRITQINCCKSGINLIVLY